MPQEFGDSEKPVDKTRDRWIREIELYDRAVKDWDGRTKKIKARYTDDRLDATSRSRRYNVLWSNVQTILPAVYARNPRVRVEKRFGDHQNLVINTAADVLEDAAQFEVGIQDFYGIMRSAILDRLLAGRGTVWIRYVPHFADVPADPGTENTEDKGEQTTNNAPDEVLEFEETSVDYVNCPDFGHTLARTWPEVRGVWRKCYMTKAEVKDRFGKECASKIPFDSHSTTEDKTNWRKAEDEQPKATIYEIWDKDSKKALWLHREYPSLLDEKDDPLKLDDFFPCPQPLFATLCNDSLIPTPDYTEYQDQAEELDLLTARINSITRSIKIAGCYDAAQPALSRIFNEGVENSLVPVDQWALMKERGGLNGGLELVDTTQMATTVAALYEARNQVKNDLYEITGMADIIRGFSEPEETATAQQIKGRFAVLRLQDLQRDVQRFARDAIRLISQVICTHFEPESIMKMTGEGLLTNQQKQQIQMQMQQFQQVQQQYQQVAQQAQQTGQQPPQAPQSPQIPEQQQEALDKPTWDEVIALFKNRPMRLFSIDVETDSMIQQDQDEEKQRRIEFVQAIGQYMGQAIPFTQQMPAAAPLMMDLMMFVTRGFDASRDLEQSFSNFKQTMEKMPPQANPEADKAKSDAALNQQKMQMEQAKAQSQMQLEQVKLEADSHRLQVETQSQLEQAKIKAASEVQSQTFQQQAESERERMRIEFEKEKLRLQPPAQEMVLRNKSKEENDQESQRHQELTQAHQALLQHVNERHDVLSQGLQQLAQAHQQLLQHAQKPRKQKVIRDGSGRISGIETIQ